MDREKIINHPKIKKIINDLKLNENQINSGLYIFAHIIDEEKQNLDFITTVEIYDENNIIPVTIANKQVIEEINRNKYHWLSYVSKINPDLNFDKVRENKTISNIKQFDKNVFYWDLPNLNFNNRSELAIWLKEFFLSYKNYQTTRGIKGFYLYGGFSLGKSTFTVAFTNYLINKKIKVAFLNVFDLYEYLKQFISETKYEQLKPIIEKLKNVDVLLIDNIGSEKPNEWFLFSILLPVLEYRLNDNKLTCFNSNLSLSQLEKYYLSAKLDRTRIKRLIDRIDSLTTKITIVGKKISS